MFFQTFRWNVNSGGICATHQMSQWDMNTAGNYNSDDKLLYQMDFVP